MADEKSGEQQHDGQAQGSQVVESLKSKELLVPALLSAASAVAVAKAPDLVKKLSGATEDAGERGADKLGEKAAEGAKRGLADGGPLGKAASKLMGGGSGGTKKTRRLPIQRWTDVAVPVDVAFDEWTKFDHFPKYMHRVLSVEPDDDGKVRWREKIWFSKREWEAQVTDRRKNDRIAWKTTGGMSHSGIVSFHRLDDRLTRVMVTIDFEPNGIVEKMASGLRFVKRAVQSDLARFKAQVEMGDAKGIEYRDGGDDEQRDEGRQNKNDDRRRAPAATR